MTKAYDALSLSGSVMVTVSTSLKRQLRLITDDDVLLVFNDGSKLLYKRHDSWRFDSLEIIEDDQLHLL